MQRPAQGVNKLLKKYWGVDATDEQVLALLERMDNLNDDEDGADTNTDAG